MRTAILLAECENGPAECVGWLSERMADRLRPSERRPKPTADRMRGDARFIPGRRQFLLPSWLASLTLHAGTLALLIGLPAWESEGSVPAAPAVDGMQVEIVDGADLDAMIEGARLAESARAAQETMERMSLAALDPPATPDFSANEPVDTARTAPVDPAPEVASAPAVDTSVQEMVLPDLPPSPTTPVIPTPVMPAPVLPAPVVPAPVVSAPALAKPAPTPRSVPRIEEARPRRQDAPPSRLAEKRREAERAAALAASHAASRAAARAASLAAAKNAARAKTEAETARREAQARAEATGRTGAGVAARNQAAQSRSTAGSGRGGGATPAAMASLRARMVAHLNRYKVYPDQAEDRGIIGRNAVTVTIGKGGNVISAGLAQSSGHSILDSASMAAVRRAQPFPAIPDGGPGSFTVTIGLLYAIR